ncbi:RNA polymerase sigma-70 factor [Urechidicola sp. KH5]
MSFKDVLFYFALKYVEDQVAEDIVQDVFLKLWQKKDEIEFKSSIKSYLFTMVRNGCLSHLEKQAVRINYKKNKEVYLKGNLQSAAHEKQGDTILIEKENDAFFQKALSKLTPRSCQVFLLSREQDKKYKEIAESLNVSIKTVEKHMTSALRTLRVELAVHYN